MRSFGKALAVTLITAFLVLFGNSGCGSDDGGEGKTTEIKTTCPCTIRGELQIWSDQAGTVTCAVSSNNGSQVVVFTGNSVIKPVCLNKKGFQLSVAANGPIALLVTRPDGTPSKAVTIVLPDGGQLVGIGEVIVPTAGTTTITVTTPEEVTGTTP